MQSESQPRPVKRGGQGEFLGPGQRFGELVSVVIMLLILAFWVYNQVTNTGLFTSKFGPWCMFAFYGSIFLSFIPPLARATIGRRNPVRPIEAFSNLFFACTCAFLFVVFPFNFAYFTAAMPHALQFLFWWISNDIAKIALVLAVIGGVIGAGVNMIRYLTYRPPPLPQYQ